MTNSWHGAGAWMVLNIAAALLLGWFVGYERYFSGRAAGSDVYCLVCATSCAVTLLAGYPSLWYWGIENSLVIAADPTKVIGTSFEVRCLIFASASERTSALSTIGNELSQLAHIEGFTLTHSSRT